MTVVVLLVLAVSVLALGWLGWPWGPSEYDNAEGSIEKEVYEFMATRQRR